jgi:hypothetical protein
VEENYKTEGQPRRFHGSLVPFGERNGLKYESGEPSAMFAAIRTWEDYLNCFNMNHGADLLTDKLSMSYKPFTVYADYRP